MQLRNILNKLAVGTFTAWGCLFACMLGVGWLFIFPGGPEHPEVSARLRWSDLWSTVVWVAPLLALLQLISFALAARMVSKLRMRFLMIVAAGVPILIGILALVLPWLVGFETPAKAIVFFLAFVGLTFGALRWLLFFPNTHETKG